MMIIIIMILCRNKRWYNIRRHKIQTTLYTYYHCPHDDHPPSLHPLYWNKYKDTKIWEMWHSTMGIVLLVVVLVVVVIVVRIISIPRPSNNGKRHSIKRPYIIIPWELIFWNRRCNNNKNQKPFMIVRMIIIIILTRMTMIQIHRTTIITSTTRILYGNY